MRRSSAPSLLEGVLVCVVLTALLSLVGAGCNNDSQVIHAVQVPSDLARVEGSIYDDVTGAVIAGATVILEGSLNSFVAASDGTGMYVIDGVPPGDYRLTAGRLGYGTTHRSIRLVSRQFEIANLGLTPSVGTGNLLARVLRFDASAGATQPLTDVFVSLPDLGITTETDAFGRFWVQDIPAGFVRVILVLEGYRDTSAIVDISVGETLQMTFEMLDQAGTLEGVVTSWPSSDPLTGVLVSIDELGISTLTDIDGSYSLERVTSGQYSVTFQAASYDSTRLVTSVMAFFVTTLDVVMTFGYGTVRGTVQDWTGVPLSNALVSIPTSGLSTYTNAFGAYLFPSNVRTGSFVAVGASHAGYVTTGTWISLGSGDIVTVDFQMFPTVGDLTGTVRNAVSLAPVSGAVCSIAYLGVSVVTNASGVYFFDDLAPGMVAVQVSAVGYTTQTTFPTVAAGGTTVHDVHLAVAP